MRPTNEAQQALVRVNADILPNPRFGIGRLFQYRRLPDDVAAFRRVRRRYGLVRLGT